MFSIGIDRRDCVVYIFQYFIVIWLSLANINGQEQVEKINYRLPNNTKPESYDLTLATSIDRNDFNFTGRVVVKLDVLEASHHITIHARQLTIKAIQLVTLSGCAIHLNPYTYDNVTEFLVIPTQTQLQKGTQYVLTVVYSGVLRTDRRGFYRASYVNAMGAIRKVLLSFYHLSCWE